MYLYIGIPCLVGHQGRRYYVVNKCVSHPAQKLINIWFQLRIDFLDFTTAQPDGDGNCVTDSITVTGGNTAVPVLCGDLTGQTIFVDFNGNTAITVTITASLATTFSRRWNVKLTQLGCDCPGIGKLTASICVSLTQFFATVCFLLTNRDLINCKSERLINQSL